jgi:hypothetical protein
LGKLKVSQNASKKDFTTTTPLQQQIENAGL